VLCADVTVKSPYKAYIPSADLGPGSATHLLEDLGLYALKLKNRFENATKDLTVAEAAHPFEMHILAPQAVFVSYTNRTTSRFHVYTGRLLVEETLEYDIHQLGDIFPSGYCVLRLVDYLGSEVYL
jgi:hypothetical protein